MVAKKRGKQKSKELERKKSRRRTGGSEEVKKEVKIRHKVTCIERKKEKK